MSAALTPVAVPGMEAQAGAEADVMANRVDDRDLLLPVVEKQRTEPQRQATGPGGAQAKPLQEPLSPSGTAAGAGVAGSPAKPTSTHPSIADFLLQPGQVPEQSPARPLGLDIIAEVQASVEDPAYVYFVTEALPVIEPYLDQHLVDWQNQEDKTVVLELEDLRLQQDAKVRVYFIKEGTAWHNSLGIIVDGEEKLIFPNASSISSFYKDATTRQEVTNKQVPLLPGDYVDLGIMEKGELLDLFLIQDGARRDNGPVFFVDKESNPDKTHHIKVHEVLDDNTLLIGFEDLPVDHALYDQDYNDLVIALEITPLDEEPSADAP